MLLFFLLFSLTWPAINEQISYKVVPARLRYAILNRQKFVIFNLTVRCAIIYWSATCTAVNFAHVVTLYSLAQQKNWQKIKSLQFSCIKSIGIPMGPNWFWNKENFYPQIKIISSVSPIISNKISRKSMQKIRSFSNFYPPIPDSLFLTRKSGILLCST